MGERWEWDNTQLRSIKCMHDLHTHTHTPLFVDGETEVPGSKVIPERSLESHRWEKSGEILNPGLLVASPAVCPPPLTCTPYGSSCGGEGNNFQVTMLKSDPISSPLRTT